MMLCFAACLLYENDWKRRVFFDDAIHTNLFNDFIRGRGGRFLSEIRMAMEDGFKRLMLPSLQREWRSFIFNADQRSLRPTALLHYERVELL